MHKFARWRVASISTAALLMMSLAGTANAALTLTPAGVSLGFTLTTFATLSPGNTGFGPFGLAVIPGKVIVFNYANGTRYVFNDVDGQTTATALASTTVNPTGTLGYASVNGVAYGGTAQFGQFAAYSSTTGAVTTVLTGVSQTTYLGMVGNPFTGHIFATTGAGQIININPAGTGSATVLVSSGSFDGLGLSPDGAIVYAENGGAIVGYNSTTGAQVYTSGSLSGGPDGTGVISSTNSLNGQIIVNFNNGQVGLINPSTNALTIIANNGTRGDYVAPDTNDGTLLLDYSEAVFRLSCGAGCSIGSNGGAGVPVPPSILLMLTGLLAAALWFYGKPYLAGRRS